MTQIAHSTSQNHFSLISELFTQGFFVAAAACLALGLMAGPLHAQDIYGTASFETGVHTLATVTMIKSAGATVNWGDGSSNAGLLSCQGLTSQGQCDILGTHIYSEPGTYSISISYTYMPPVTLQQPFGCGNIVAPAPCPETASAQAIISLPGKFVILTIGDSVASGEGVPVVDANLDLAIPNNVHAAYWDDEQSDYGGGSGSCHRSSNAGFVQAQQSIQSTSPEFTTTINYACSGDNIAQTIQALKNARDVLPRIDVLLISVGADNVDGGFGNLIEQCLDPVVPCSINSSFKTTTSDSIANLTSCSGPSSSCYRDLAEEINCINPSTDTPDSSCTNPSEQIPKLVLITEYFDPTHNQFGIYPVFQSCGAAGNMLKADWQYLHDSVVVPLNQAVDGFPLDAALAGLTVPTYAVTGIQNDFLDHGYCAGPLLPDGLGRWVNTAADSGLIQGDIEGTSHPNSAGQADYKSRIYNAIVTYNPPATTAFATSDAYAYRFGTWTSQPVDVTLSATNGVVQAGVGPTFFAVDNLACYPAVGTASLNAPPGCSRYSGPFTISATGQHIVTYFSVNKYGYPEQVHMAQVWIKPNAPPPGSALGVHLVAALTSLTAKTITIPGIPPFIPPKKILIGYAATVNIENTGAATAAGLEVTGAELNGQSALSGIAVSVSSLPSGGSLPVLLQFGPVGPEGSPGALSITEAYQGGTANGAFRVILP